MSKSRNNNRRTAAAVVPKDLAEHIGEAVAEVIEREVLDQPAVKPTTTTESAAPAEGGTDVGKIVGDVNPIAAAGYSIHTLYERHKNKSGIIRALAEAGFQTKHIAKFLDIRYQHVRNVIMNPLKREGATTTAATTLDKTDPKMPMGENGNELVDGDDGAEE